MLLKFYCSNYKSIKEEISFSMFSGTYKRHNNHIVPLNDKGVLRTSAIYGANGSGKTNLLLALQFLRKTVVVENSRINQKLKIPIFKLSNCENMPTKMELDFFHKNTRYQYSIEYRNNLIVKEELYKVTNDNNTIIIFKRFKENEHNRLTIFPNKKKSQKERFREEIYAEELNDNQSFFNIGFNKNIEGFDEPFDWFKNHLKFISLDSNLPGLASTFLLDKDFLNASKKIIKNARVGISDFKLADYSYDEIKSLGVEFPINIESNLLESNDIGIEFKHDGDLYSSYRDNGNLRFVKISTIHEDKNGKPIEFKFAEESKGVQRLFELLPAIYRTIHKGEVFLIDEIETSFHPILIKEILKLYLDSTPTNSGQIIFTTHESHLLDLDLFRQDEIWFCEKTKDGSSKLYSLSEFKPRFDKDIRKGYFEGQFGFVPFLGDRNQLEL
jgi:AAA15 family ATPase/GTPase